MTYNLSSIYLLLKMSCNENHGFIQTKSSLLKRSVPDFKVITYESHKAKPKKLKQHDSEVKDKLAQIENVWDMKRARHEIIKFGMSGFDPEKKQEAKIQLAINLGAKPPKNKYKNYKKLQEEKRNEIKTQQERIEFNQLGKNQLGKSDAKGKYFKKKKEATGLLDRYGKATKNKK